MNTTNSEKTKRLLEAKVINIDKKIVEWEEKLNTLIEQRDAAEKYNSNSKEIENIDKEIRKILLASEMYKVELAQLETELNKFLVEEAFNGGRKSRSKNRIF